MQFNASMYRPEQGPSRKSRIWWILRLLRLKLSYSFCFNAAGRANLYRFVRVSRVWLRDTGSTRRLLLILKNVVRHLAFVTVVLTRIPLSQAHLLEALCSREGCVWHAVVPLVNELQLKHVVRYLVNLRLQFSTATFGHNNTFCMDRSFFSQSHPRLLCQIGSMLQNTSRSPFRKNHTM
jgi:hypothetical protein